MDSQAIVNTMEVLETKPISELVAEAVIKVCYVSDEPNNNNTVITREVGKEIAATLPGAPVAGFFNRDSGDFEEHNRKITFNNGEINIEDITKAYGFVSFESPWYQDFMEDGVVRTYLMCKAYLWTRQYEEASLAFNKGQSMELDEKSMSGYYQGDVFVFTSVTLDKLCILGDDYKPCFAGAKIMTTYARQYGTLAEQLENTIGRRYYVVSDQLVTKPEKVTLEYALELGWNLDDAVYSQLAKRGGSEKYRIEGIYTEQGEVFVILQDRETLEYLRCVLTITDQETVELAPDMTAVTMKWETKLPPDPEPVESLSGDSAVPEQEIPMNVASTYADGTTPAAGDATTTPPTDFAEEDADECTCGKDPCECKEEEEKTNHSDSVTVIINHAAADEKCEECGKNPCECEDDKTNNTDNSITVNHTEDEKCEECGKDPCECEDDKTNNTLNHTENPPVDGAAPVDGPDVDYKAKFETLSAEVDGYKAQITEFTATIETLKGQLATFQAAEAKLIEDQKSEVVASYTDMLTEDEMKDVVGKIAEYTLDDVEAKLAVLYTRKVKASKQPVGQFQVNIDAADNTPELPEFMKQALEYDKAKELTI